MFRSNTNKENLITAIALCIFGISLIVFPVGALSVILRVIGAVILIAKAVKIINIVRSYTRSPEYTVILINEILIAVFALVLIINPASTINVITLIIGVYLLASSAMRIYTYAKMPKSAPVWVAIVFDGLSALAGLWLIFHPASLAQLVGVFIGAASLIKGVAMLVGLLSAKKKSASNNSRDYISTDFKDKSDE